MVGNPVAAGGGEGGDGGAEGSDSGDESGSGGESGSSDSGDGSTAGSGDESGSDSSDPTSYGGETAEPPSSNPAEYGDSYGSVDGLVDSNINGDGPSPSTRLRGSSKRGSTYDDPEKTKRHKEIEDNFGMYIASISRYGVVNVTFSDNLVVPKNWTEDITSEVLAVRYIKLSDEKN